MNTIKVKDLICVTGGRTKVVIYNTKDNEYVEVWSGVVDDIDFKNVPFGDCDIDLLTVINEEDILQIHIVH